MHNSSRTGYRVIFDITTDFMKYFFDFTIKSLLIGPFSNKNEKKTGKSVANQYNWPDEIRSYR